MICSLLDIDISGSTGHNNRISAHSLDKREIKSQNAEGRQHTSSPLLPRVQNQRNLTRDHGPKIDPWRRMHGRRLTERHFEFEDGYATVIGDVTQMIVLAHLDV
jgi:hypothetical protein